MSSLDFGLLRARLESELDRPAVISITASSSGDLHDVAALALASALAAAGYPTLYIDTSGASRTPTKLALGLSFAEIGRQLSPALGENLTSLSVSEPRVQRTASRREIDTALDALKSKFDYVIVSTERSIAPSFAESIFCAADAVLVTVKRGRRQTADDQRLSDTLERIGDRFLGVLTIDSRIAREEPATFVTTPAAADGRRAHPVHVA